MHILIGKLQIICVMLANVQPLIIKYLLNLGPVDNNTVAARYQGSPGGKVLLDGKKKGEPFGTFIYYVYPYLNHFLTRDAHL